MFGLYLFLSDVTNKFVTSLNICGRKRCGLFYGKRDEDEEEEDVKIRLLNKRTIIG